jgi:hypothetical protein
MIVPNDESCTKTEGDYHDSVVALRTLPEEFLPFEQDPGTFPDTNSDVFRCNFGIGQVLLRCITTPHYE